MAEPTGNKMGGKLGEFGEKAKKGLEESRKKAKHDAASAKDQVQKGLQEASKQIKDKVEGHKVHLQKAWTAASARFADVAALQTAMEAKIAGVNVSDLTTRFQGTKLNLAVFIPNSTDSVQKLMRFTGIEIPAAMSDADQSKLAGAIAAKMGLAKHVYDLTLVDASRRLEARRLDGVEAVELVAEIKSEEDALAMIQAAALRTFNAIADKAKKAKDKATQAAQQAKKNVQEKLGKASAKTKEAVDMAKKATKEKWAKLSNKFKDPAARADLKTEMKEQAKKIDKNKLKSKYQGIVLNDNMEVTVPEADGTNEFSISGYIEIPPTMTETDRDNVASDLVAGLGMESGMLTATLVPSASLSRRLQARALNELESVDLLAQLKDEDASVDIASSAALDTASSAALELANQQASQAAPACLLGLVALALA